MRLYHLSQRRVGVLGIGRLVVFLFRQCIAFCIMCRLCSRAEVHVKRSVILPDCFGPDILSAFWTKGQVLHRERAHLKVPGFSIVLNVLLTRKLPMFLSCLNEISSGWEKIAPVSGLF